MSDNPYYIYGELFGSNKKKGAPRVPIEEPEGINYFISTSSTDDFPRGAGGKPPGAVSLTKIEVGDLISEGEIQGLVTGEFTYDGAVGNVGWTSALPLIYENAPNITPPVKWLRSVFWNEVPVVSSKNEYNFTDINVAFTPGLPGGHVLADTTPTSTRLSNETTISRGIGERLRFGPDFAKTYRILNKDCKSVRVNIKVGQLSTTSKDPSTMGDLLGTSVTYKIYKRPIYTTTTLDSQFTLHKEEEIKGKISFGYIKSTEVRLTSRFLENIRRLVGDKSTLIGWEIKIERTSQDSIDSATRNQTYVDSITEVYGDVFKYPCSAIVASKFSAEYFSAVPSRAYDVKLLKVKIPSNYDPIKKTYNGSWDGTFKTDKEWTDNPAWCYYDLITNTRYGLGKFIDTEFVDKWTLYNIGRYCDTIVNNGEGGKEPRFTCNLVINSREDAYKVINDFASIFQAITYYNAGSIFAVQDSLKTPVWQFTNASVENGDFLYSSTSRRARNTVAMVRYNDKNNFYKPAVEYVEDIDGIRKYGIREIDLAAFGCTSRGQALRYGRWALLSETLETESVSFTVGTEGARIAPGDIIQTFDANRHESRYGGRLEAALQFGAKTRLTLDSYITGFVPANYYKISVLTPTYTYDPSIVSNLDSSDIDNIRRSSLQTRTFLGSFASGITGLDSGVRTDISFLNTTFNEGFNVTDYDISGRYVWMIENSGNSSDIANNVWDYWRALRIEEQDDGVKYSISAIEYNDSKFNKMESGLAFEQPGYGDVPLRPYALTLTLHSPRPSPNSHLIDYRFLIPNNNFTNIAGYLIYVRKGEAPTVTDSTYLVDRLSTYEMEGSYVPLEDGKYYFAVYSVNSQGITSVDGATESITVVGVNPILDVVISSLQLAVDDSFTANEPGKQLNAETDEIDPVFRWQVAMDVGTLSIPSDVQYRITFREPYLDSESVPGPNIYYQITGYKTNDFSYQLEFTGNVGNFKDYSAGLFSPKPGPFREFEVVVEAMSPNGKTSADKAGNTIKRWPDEPEAIRYNNPKGYDILYVNNPPIRDKDLSPGGAIEDRPILGGFGTNQWILPDGDIKINITGTALPDDTAGVFVYTSANTFTADDVKRSDKRLEKNIQIFQVTEGSSNSIVVSPGYERVDKAYVAIGFYDTFDEAIRDDNTQIEGDNVDIETDPNYNFYVSPPVEIVKKGGAKTPSVFQAWFEFHTLIGAGANAQGPHILNSYNIDRDRTKHDSENYFLAESRDNEGHRIFKFTVFFKNPVILPYIVFVGKDYNSRWAIDGVGFLPGGVFQGLFDSWAVTPLGGTSQATVIRKDSTGFEVAVFIPAVVGYSDTFFFGVLKADDNL